MKRMWAGTGAGANGVDRAAWAAISTNQQRQGIAVRLRDEMVNNVG
jgi:hypothetical protein